jgi:hypothetical protein
MFGEDAAHHIFVQFDAEQMADLLGNPQMAEIRVSGFHFDDCRDQFGRWSLWPGPATGSGGREQSPVFAIDSPSTTRSKDVKFGARLRERPTMTS